MTLIEDCEEPMMKVSIRGYEGVVMEMQSVHNSACYTDIAHYMVRLAVDDSTEVKMKDVLPDEIEQIND